MATTTATPEVKPSSPVDVLNMIAEAKTLWGKINHLAIGRIFVNLRERTDYYKANKTTSLTYAQAVKATTVPWSSAEFYRNMAETCDAAKLKEAIFLALHDSGVNLASERFKAAITTKEVQKLDASDSVAVDLMADALKKKHPKPAAEKSEKLTDAQLLKQSETDKADITAIIANTSSVSAKKVLEAKLQTLDEDILELRSNLRKKIEATATELAALLSQAKDKAERPAESFWKSIGLLLDFTPATTHHHSSPAGSGPTVKKLGRHNFAKKVVHSHIA